MDFDAEAWSEDLRQRRNPAQLIYGILAIASVIAAESTRRETYAKLLIASAITLALYWLAHAYSHHWAARLEGSEGWTLREFASSMAYESSILAGALLPGLALVSAWLAGAPIETGVTAALWSAGVEVALLEVFVGVRHHVGTRDMLVQAAIGAVLGLGILAIRIILH